jgi:hypothetical protein
MRLMIGGPGPGPGPSPSPGPGPGLRPARGACAPVAELPLRAGLRPEGLPR